MEKKEFGIKLLASKAFFEDFSKLCKLTVKQIDLFANVFKSDDGFKFGDDEVKKFLVESDVQPETYSSIASLVKYLFDNALSKDVIFDDLFEKLVEYAKEKSINLSKTKANAIQRLFKFQTDIHAKHTSKQYLYGVLPSVKSVSAVQELRTIFHSSEENNKKIKELLPISLIRFILSDDQGTEKEFHFQANLETLNKLLDYFQDYKDKLEIITKFSKSCDISCGEN